MSPRRLRRRSHRASTAAMTTAARPPTTPPAPLPAQPCRGGSQLCSCPAHLHNLCFRLACHGMASLRRGCTGSAGQKPLWGGRACNCACTAAAPACRRRLRAIAWGAGAQVGAGLHDHLRAGGEGHRAAHELVLGEVHGLELLQAASRARTSALGRAGSCPWCSAAQTRMWLRFRHPPRPECTWSGGQTGIRHGRRRRCASRSRHASALPLCHGLLLAGRRAGAPGKAGRHCGLEAVVAQIQVLQLCKPVVDAPLGQRAVEEVQRHVQRGQLHAHSGPCQPAAGSRPSSWASSSTHLRQGAVAPDLHIACWSGCCLACTAGRLCTNQRGSAGLSALSTWQQAQSPAGTPLAASL